MSDNDIHVYFLEGCCRGTHAGTLVYQCAYSHPSQVVCFCLFGEELGVGGVLLTSRFKCSSGTSHSLRDESWGKADNRS